MSQPDLPVSDTEALDLVCQLMAIRGGSGDEGAVMDFLTEKLREAGGGDRPLEFDTANHRSANGGKIGNAFLRFDGEGPRRLLMAHTDTVPVCLGSQPRVADGVVRSADPTTGLGADDRSGTAVLLTTAIGLLRSGVRHMPLTLLWTVQEETGLHGARHVEIDKLGGPTLAFNFDGGSPTKLLAGATGGYRLGVEVRGYPSHAGIAPEKGVSALAIAAIAVADLVENGWHGLVRRGDKSGTTNVGMMASGVATNVVAEQATLRVEARSHDSTFRMQMVAAIEAAFLRAVDRVTSSEGRRGSVEFSGGLNYESFRLPDDCPSLIAAKDAVASFGFEPEVAISNGGLDANWLSARGIPTVTLGCGQRNIHTVDEELDIEQFQLARRIAWRLATGR